MLEQDAYAVDVVDLTLTSEVLLDAGDDAELLVVGAIHAEFRRSDRGRYAF